MKLAIFDLDGTLAPIGRPIESDTIEQMKRLQKAGVQIALCSGKPIYYLCGLVRQTGLPDVILLGENGASMQVGIDLPPKTHYILPYSEAARRSIQLIHEQLLRQLPELWYQPNEVGLTPFFDTEEQNKAIGAVIAACADRISDVDIYPQVDCYDITPRSISKAAGIEALGNYLHIDAADMVVVGDGINDYPMFQYAGYSIGIHLQDAGLVDYNAPDIHAAMQRLLSAFQPASCCP